ncbi:MAG: hypothetical protein KCHDKBKB_02208 [Elusimicrobia bacterium]|nr:hypothetical protein [Elusimicrobiota bacterium]
MKSRVLLFILASMLSHISMAGPQYIPVINGLFTTGQWYFEGDKSELGGNAAITFVPALKYSDKFTLIPTVQSYYHGTRTAEELAGGNTLFQDTWDNGIGVKAVHSLNEKWNIKENIGARFKWFRETTDERWTHGLYDYRILNAGLEAERKWGKKTSIAAGYDISLLQFPNYVSLESSQSEDRSREYAGENVLDTRSHLFSLRIKAPLFWGLSTSLNSFLTPRYYTDQHVVQLTGLLSATTRDDLFSSNTLSIDRVFTLFRKTKLISTVIVGHNSLDSNQNHYDAKQTYFAANYYDYDQNIAGLQMNYAFGSKMQSPMLINLGYNYSHRNYRSRTIQDADGAYLNEKLYLIEQAINLGFSYPLAKNFRVKMSTTFAQSKSNNNFESLYRYNYHNSEYQFGFTYDY